MCMPEFYARVDLDQNKKNIKMRGNSMVSINSTNNEIVDLNLDINIFFSTLIKIGQKKKITKN